MEKLEKNVKVKKEEFLSEKAINDVLNDFKDVREYAEKEGKPISCMCVICSASLCGNASPTDYMTMLTSTLVNLIEGDVLDVDDLSIIVKTTLKYLGKTTESKTKDKNETKEETKDDVKKLISVLDELKDVIKELKDI